MSHSVSFVEKNGKPGKASFPTLALATSYARTVKQGKVVAGGSDDATTVTVVQCGKPEDVDAMRRNLADSILREHASEAYMEVGCETMLLGGSTSEALNNARRAHGAVMAGNICACGKRCGSHSVCYTCRRFF